MTPTPRPPPTAPADPGAAAKPRDPPSGPQGGAGTVPISTLFYFMGVTVLAGWLLVLGKAIILPLVVSLMLTYVLAGAARALRAAPVYRTLPVWLSYLTVLVLAVLSVALIVLIAVVNLRAIAFSVADSENVLTDVVAPISRRFGFTDTPTWETLRTMTLDRLDLTAMSLNLLSSVAAIGGYTLLILTYVAFMLAERAPLLRRIDRLLPDDTERGATRALFDRINNQIVTYLSTKTLINALLGLISYVLLLLLGIENAVFWAFMIAIFNYIPYVGSMMGVGIVIVYLVVLHGDIAWTILALVLLSAAQVYVGNYLEPRVMSRSMNLSPLVVLVALVVWSSLWGLPGAIIAVPMTSILLIVLAAFNGTRFIPALLSRDGQI